MASDSESEAEEAPSEDEGLQISEAEVARESGEERDEPPSEDEAGSERGAASEAAEDSGNEQNARVEALLRKIKDAESEKEKVAVAEELHRFCNKNPDDLAALGPRCVPWLIEGMQTSSPLKLRAASAGALWVLIGDASNTQRILDTPGALKAIVEEAMPNTRGSPLLRENCLACLGNMSFHESAHPKLLKADVVKAQVEGLSSSSVSVQWQCAYGLSNLAGTAEGRAAIPNSAVQRLFQIIRGKATDKRVNDTKVVALGCVNAISADESRQTLVIKVFNDILDNIKDPPKKTNEWQQKCVDSIVFICEQSDAYVKAFAGRDTVELLFGCLKCDPDMRRAAAAGLCLFARYGEFHNLVRRPDDSGVSTLLKALEDKDSQTASLALQAIWNLAGHADARTVLARKNAVHALQKRIQSAPAVDKPAIMSVLCCMAKEESVREEVEPLEVIRKLAKSLDAADPALRLQAVVALGQLSGDDKLLDWIIESGIASQFVQNMHSDEEEVQERVIETVQQVATSVVGRQQLHKAGAVPQLMKVLKSTSGMYVRQVTLGSLMNMAVDDECCQEISRRADFGVLMGLMTLKDAPPEVAEYATGLVWHVSDLEESRARIGSEKGAVPCLVGLLESASTDVRENVCGALANLASLEANRPRIRAAGAIRHLAEGTKSEHGDVARNAHLALQRLLEDEDCKREIEAIDNGRGALLKRLSGPAPPPKDQKDDKEKEADKEKKPAEDKKEEKKKKKKKKKKEQEEEEEEEEEEDRARPPRRAAAAAAVAAAAAAAAPSPRPERPSMEAPPAPPPASNPPMARRKEGSGSNLIPIEISPEAHAALERARVAMKINVSMAVLALVACWDRRERHRRRQADGKASPPSRRRRRGEESEGSDYESQRGRPSDGRPRESNREQRTSGEHASRRDAKRRREQENVPPGPPPPLLIKVKMGPNPALLGHPRPVPRPENGPANGPPPQLMGGPGQPPRISPPFAPAAPGRGRGTLFARPTAPARPPPPFRYPFSAPSAAPDPRFVQVPPDLHLVARGPPPPHAVPPHHPHAPPHHPHAVPHHPHPHAALSHQVFAPPAPHFDHPMPDAAAPPPPLEAGTTPQHAHHHEAHEGEGEGNEAPPESADDFLRQLQAAA